MIGDDRQRLDRGAAEPAALLPLAPKDVRQVRRGLEMPAPAALDQLDPAPGIMAFELGQRRRHVDAVADIERDIRGAQRLRRREQGRLDRPQRVRKLAHAALT